MNDLESYADELADDGTRLPPECYLDKYHPANHEYFAELNMTRRRIASQQALMKRNAVRAVACSRTGKNNTEISKIVGIGPSTVSKYLSSNDGNRLRALLDYQQQQIDGPDQNHRKSILYRIVIDNQLTDPNVSISAIKEINKMAGTYEQKGQGNTINIQINNDLMPKTGLDVLPETFESKQLESDQ